MLVECFSGGFRRERAFLKLILIRVVVKPAHKPFARTAYRKTISTLLEIPCQSCSSFIFIGLQLLD